MGEYNGGKREGYGYMILPDGGLYEGQFKADKFEGQVRSSRSISWICPIVGHCEGQLKADDPILAQHDPF